MATICCAPNTVTYMFADESGATTGPYFVGALFCTKEPDDWRKLIESALEYPYSLHFQKIGRRADRRYHATHRLIDLLEAHADAWFGHYLRIERRLVDASAFAGDQIEFNHWMGLLVRVRTSTYGHCYSVTMADRDRNHADGYLPLGLQRELEGRQLSGEGPHVELDLALANRDRLLQVADLLASATRQLVAPSGNPLKQEIAERVGALVARGPNPPPSQRLFGFELPN